MTNRSCCFDQNHLIQQLVGRIRSISAGRPGKVEISLDANVDVASPANRVDVELNERHVHAGYKVGSKFIAAAMLEKVGETFRATALESFGVEL